MSQEIEAHQYTGSVLSLNALQLWILSGTYKEVEDRLTQKCKNGQIYAVLDNGQVTQLQLNEGDWVILVNGRFFKSSHQDWMQKNLHMDKTA